MPPMTNADAPGTNAINATSCRWWEGMVAARKIGIAAIGVFGASMQSMQVHLTLMLVFVAILTTAVVKPYHSESKPLGPTLHRLEIGTLVSLFSTLWAAGIFREYPRCQSPPSAATGVQDSEGWCEALALAVGLLNIAVVIVVVAVFLQLKGVGVACVSACLAKVRMAWEQRGGAAGRRARIMSRTFDATDTTTMEMRTFAAM